MPVDLIIIGGGPAGYLGAERAAQAGHSVLLFEKRALGGVCLNEGCMPTKTLLHSAKLYENAMHGKAYGVIAQAVSIDHAAVIERKNKVVRTLVAGVNAKMKKQGVTVIKEAAKIIKKTEEGFAVSAGGQIYEAGKLLIATGSEAIIPPIPGIMEGLVSGFVMTSREILDKKELPRRLLVIGGGIIGLEMAAYFAAVGVQVTVVEMLGKIAGNADGEIAERLLNALKEKGVDFQLGSRVTEIFTDGIAYEKEGQQKRLDADAILLCIGRCAPEESLGLEAIGVETERGFIATDQHLQTNIPHVYAAGDCNGKSMLAHTAYREAEVAVNHMLGKADSMCYGAIPSVIYTSPEVACVGETEESAREKGLEFIVKKLSMRFAGRFIAENDRADGLCKLLVETGSRHLIGAHLIGGYASEIIYGAAMMIESQKPVEDLQKIIFPHPTVGEIIRESLFL